MGPKGGPFPGQGGRSRPFTGQTDVSPTVKCAGTGHAQDAAPYFPLTTFGTGEHAGNDDLVEVPEIGAVAPWGLDPEIVPVIMALNRAGIKTVQSCQDVGDLEGLAGDDKPPEVVRTGIVVVAWETFPALAEMVAKSSLGGLMGVEANESGWLFVAHADARYVSVLFPWRDVDEFAAAAEAATS